ncbi:hypothetical protein FEM48_ZijujUnG0101600 [Ziziphus jujuba var. spinosa]|uniref:ATP-dependent RNA helicase n=1 Tax=Ziziphus jujuba var. spinosa TaxID=714518 RepID=A0A978U895_ZIZJJ|nr:hypothetical protein FEM48_ZijujUnG0101600 [Ziziphus jujuba var. spinosa]
MNGKKTAGAVLKRCFQMPIGLKQRWIEVTDDTQVDELLKAVNQGFKSKSVDIGSDQCRTMVFANTVDAVEEVAKILLRSGIERYRYHKDCSLEERAKTIDDFQEKGGILVCTDAASRGVDIPNISRVIQAFVVSTSAVDFIHRIGRIGISVERRSRIITRELTNLYQVELVNMDLSLAFTLNPIGMWLLLFVEQRNLVNQWRQHLAGKEASEISLRREVKVNFSIERIKIFITTLQNVN